MVTQRAAIVMIMNRINNRTEADVPTERPTKGAVDGVDSLVTQVATVLEMLGESGGHGSVEIVDACTVIEVSSET